jgi:peptidyl-prolyl cis-trans isomerase C
MMAATTTSEVPPVFVNGVGITAGQIHSEMQYHPAETLVKAQEMATQALVVREFLLQEAQRKGIFADRCAIKDEQAVIDDLLKMEVQVPEPDRSSCERYYQSNKSRFVTSPLFQTSHILFSASIDDTEARTQALRAAEDVLDILKKTPLSFAELAKEFSNCSSGKEGGRLGQLSKGQTTLEFETALFKMQKDEVSAEPVPTRYGYHIILVHERAESQELPFEAVQEWIADYLKQSVWKRAVAQYIGILAGKAEVKGYTVKGSDTPLVQ